MEITRENLKKIKREILKEYLDREDIEKEKQKIEKEVNEMLEKLLNKNEDEDTLYEY